ncbi:hypothetical protein J2S42_007434 [Catenuloplanes indicus]|uniref:Uncharacterized protein n=1 Tax=Catenuloplanes indicus TaxID=137267 RepID=A0AAE3W955_9ACTN|nr:hypothetical protein [Catenuloplanes indicus]
MVDQQHAPCQGDGGRPVRDDDRGAAAQQPAQRLVDAVLDRDVDRAGRVVQHQHRRVDQQRPRDRDALPLPAGERVAAFADHGVVPVLQGLDEVVGPGGARRGPDLRAARVRPAERDVRVHRLGEQERLVRHDPDLVAEPVQTVVAHVPAVDRDGSAGHVVVAGDQPADRGLAGPGRADQRDRLTGADVEIEAVQRAGAVRVVEPDVVEPHRTADRRVESVRRRLDVRPGVQDLVDALRGRGRALPQHDHHAEHAERRLEHQHVRVERHDRAHGGAAVDHHQAAEEQHQRQAEPRQVVQHGIPPAADRRVAHVDPAHPVRGRGQRVHLALLGRERLDDPYALDVLVDHGREPGQPRLDHPRHREHRPPHAQPEHTDQRHRRHRHARQRHVDGQHQPERDQRDRALHHDRRAERQVHLHRANVRTGPGHQLAGLHPVVERVRHAHQVRVDDGAEVVLHLVRGAQQIQPGQEVDHALGQRQPHDLPDERLQGGRARHQRRVDPAPYQIRDLHLHDQPGERQHQRRNQQPPVRPHDRRGPPQPALRDIRIDPGPGRPPW